MPRGRSAPRVRGRGRERPPGQGPCAVPPGPRRRRTSRCSRRSRRPACPPAGGGGAGVGRDAQSIAFLSTPGIDPLYSGVANSTASASRIAAMNASAPGIPPPVSCSSVSSNGSTALSSSNTTSSTPGGSSSAAARSRRRLCESGRSDPTTPRTRIVLVLVVGERQLKRHRDRHVVAEYHAALGQRGVPLQAELLAIDRGLQIDTDLLDV